MKTRVQPRMKNRRTVAKPGRRRSNLRAPAKEVLIPLPKLKDGAWYRGEGRNNHLGRWDSEARCFWVVSFANFSDPARYPEGSTRLVRLKQEDYFSAKGGTFKPLALV